MTKQVKRIAMRVPCAIDVSACTPVATRPARIVDLTAFGAQVHMRDPYPTGTRFHIDLAGDYVWATVMWDEIDRMGIRFEAPLTQGALHRRLASLTAAATRIRPGGVPAFGRKAA